MKEISNKLLKSVHFEYLINAVKNGKEPPQICKELNEEKNYPISLPTVREAVKFVKKNYLLIDGLTNSRVCIYS